MDLSIGLNIGLKAGPPDNADGSAVTTVRRIELITGTGRRRQWSADGKARIIVESLKPGANVSEVARRHGLNPQQLFGWRRQARGKAVGKGVGRSCRAWSVAMSRSEQREVEAGGGSPALEPAFAPVVIASAGSSPAPAAPRSPPADMGLIEISIGDAMVRVRGQAETGLLIAVLRAVRRAS